jgi:Flp pilus assembly protein TadG
MKLRTTLRRLMGERGQALPLVALSAVVLIGFAGLGIDLARVWVTQQELQRAVDAAALAAAQDLPNSSTAYNDAVAYSGTGSNGNAVGGSGVSASNPSVTFECVSHGPNYVSGSPPTCLTDTSNDNCHPTGSNTPTSPSGTPTTCNAVNVTETATVKTGLLSLFIPSFTVSASSTSGSRTSVGVPKPMNLFVILDTTGSMEDSCSATVTGISSPYSPDKLDCAKAGVRSFLQSMPYTTVGGTPEADNDVGITVFPALSTTLTDTVTFTGTITSSGTTSAKKKITGVNTDESAYVGDSISGTGIPSGTTISATSGSSPNYTVTISNAATSSGTYTFTVTVPGTYALANPTPPTASVADETDCTSSDRFGVTYPPYATYTTSQIPALDLYTSGSSYTSPGIIDNYLGYEAVPLSSDYQTNGNLNTSSNLVRAVDWAQCSGAKYPGGDYYGIKEIGGQGSYLAGAITEAQYLLSTSTRTTGPTGQPVTNGIVILSDGELNDPSSGSDGVDPGASGNQSFASSTPCEDAIQAAKAAKLAGTLIFSIAYDDSNTSCSDGSGTGSPASATCPVTNQGYSGSGKYDGSACALMQYLATNSTYFADQSNAGDLSQDFTEAANELTGDSDLIPDCTQAPPDC